MEVFKIINGLDSIFPADFFIMENEHSKTKGHPYTISKLHSRLDIRKYSFTQRIVNDWNRLPGCAFMSASVNQFKGHIDKYLQNRAEDYTRVGPFYVNSSIQGKFKVNCVHLSRSDTNHVIPRETVNLHL